ncbi:MAG: hypothetical protein KDA28_00805 [Phycisphaerales bacterium]|nr:hypothetical protein [Phycisphaerales bacterium]
MSHRQFTYDSVTVWTDGTTTAIYHPLSPVLETTEVETVRLALEMSQYTGNITMNAAYDLSDDGCDWDTPVIIQDTNSQPFVDADGIDQSTLFVDIATSGTNAKRYMRFGVLALKTSSDTLSVCRASLQVDVRC